MLRRAHLYVSCWSLGGWEEITYGASRCDPSDMLVSNAQHVDAPPLVARSEMLLEIDPSTYEGREGTQTQKKILLPHLTQAGIRLTQSVPSFSRVALPSIHPSIPPSPSALQQKQHQGALFSPPSMAHLQVHGPKFLTADTACQVRRILREEPIERSECTNPVVIVRPYTAHDKAIGSYWRSESPDSPLVGGGAS